MFHLKKNSRKHFDKIMSSLSWKQHKEGGQDVVKYKPGPSQALQKYLNSYKNPNSIILLLVKARCQNNS